LIIRKKEKKKKNFDYIHVSLSLSQKKMKKEALVPKLTSELPPFTLKDHPKFVVLVVILFCIAFFIAMTFCGYEQDKEKENYVPNITIPSMDFTVLNITETHLSVKWDLLLRIPRDLPGWYMCLKGDFQLSIIYRGVTIATSSIERLNFFSILLSIF